MTIVLLTPPYIKYILIISNRNQTVPNYMSDQTIIIAVAAISGLTVGLAFLLAVVKAILNGKSK